MPKQFPPLSPIEVCKIAEACGWQAPAKQGRNVGDHRYYYHPDVDLEKVEEFPQYSPLQVDMGEKKRKFGPHAIKSLIQRMGITREEFYGATKKTAKKINIPYKKK